MSLFKEKTILSIKDLSVKGLDFIDTYEDEQGQIKPKLYAIVLTQEVRQALITLHEFSGTDFTELI